MWRPVVKWRDELRNKVTVRKISHSSYGIYIPFNIMEKLEHGWNCYCIVNEWIGSDGDGNSHKLLF